jgi:cytochrome c-type biogenesis protein
VFVLLGAGATLAGQWFSRHLETLGLAAGLALIVMGLNFLGLFRLDFLKREARISTEAKPHSPAGAYAMGLAFAFGWTPCVGPVLAAILMVAGTEESAFKGAALLLVYSLGIGLPFLAAAWAARPFLAWLGRFKSRLGMVEKISGGFLVLTGLFILTGSMSAIANWLLINIPVLGRIG